MGGKLTLAATSATWGNMQKLSDLHAHLWADYGPIMDAKDLCKVLRYPTVAALNTARMRGLLPFSPITLGHRRGFFALTKEIAELLERADVERNATTIAPRDDLQQRNMGDRPQSAPANLSTS